MMDYLAMLRCKTGLNSTQAARLLMQVMAVHRNTPVYFFARALSQLDTIEDATWYDRLLTNAALDIGK